MSSKPANWTYSVRAQATNLARLADRLGLKNITLVLHELGGPIGLSFAFENMNRIGRIVLANTWFWDTAGERAISHPSQLARGPLGKMAFQTMNSAPKRIRALFSDKRKYTDAVHRAYFGPFQAGHDRHGAYATAKQFEESSGWFGELWAERKKLLERPLMLLWGMKDTVFDEKTLNRIWHEFPLAEVHRYDHAGHFLAEEQPTAMAEAIRAFTSVSADRAYTA
jgi:haloalkane dehalogenase